MLSGIDSSFIDTAKDHLACCGLQHARDNHIDVLADKPPGIVDNYHGAVIEVGYTLIVFLPFFKDKNAHCFARQYYWFERIGKLIDIEDLDPAQVSNFVQIEIVGHNRRLKLLP